MASNKFVANSTGSVVVRKDDIVSFEIVHVALHTDPETYEYHLNVKLRTTQHIGYIGVGFETDPTLQGIQAKAATLLVELES